MTFIIDSRSDSDTHRVGGKASALFALIRSGFPIPPFFVLSTEAFSASLNTRQRQIFTAAKSPRDADTIITNLAPSHTVTGEIRNALGDLCPSGERVAVRSSSLDEDSAQHSFAGQLDSFLFVSNDQVVEAVAAVWRSGFTERVLAYRVEAGLSVFPQPPAVLVQRMVNAEVSGVAFSADPVTGQRGIRIVAAVYGLGSALVSGECDADTYHIDRKGQILTRVVAEKRIAHRFTPHAADTVSSVAVPENQARQPALSDTEIQSVATLVRDVELACGRPQDIEWGMKDGKLYLLQARPITTLTHAADPDGVLNIWDNSNIAESYGGVTTPLTFSFARRTYEAVYRQFCHLMKVPKVTIDANDELFRRMLGLIRGRIYYNLLSWYRVLAMLPGFTINRRFMEQMMGVKEGLPKTLVSQISKTGWNARVRDAAHLAWTMVGLFINHIFLQRIIRTFYRRLDQTLRSSLPLQEMRPDELSAYYVDLERQLLTRWDAPLINDFFAMVFYGVLRTLTQKWCHDPEGTLQNDLLCDEGGMISAEPARRIRDMAEIAKQHLDFLQVLIDGSPTDIRHAIDRMPEFKHHYDAYLNKFGERCLDELKLESPTLHDDPLILLRAICQLARHHHTAKGVNTSHAESTVRDTAKRKVRIALGRNPLRWMIFQWVLSHTRARVRDRENLRFERTRVFGRVRRIFVELGRRFHALELLESPRDIFYLEVHETLSFIDGTTSTTALKDLVALRKTEFEAYRQDEAPSDRFETHGMVHHGNSFLSDTPARAMSSSAELDGIGCCPGIVRGPVRVITDPRNAYLEPGDILVAERTDPGWIMLFTSAAGVLVERGSLLSHAAIVARELGIPAVVSIAGITRWVKDGDWVELNGSNGKVRRLNNASEHYDKQ